MTFLELEEALTELLPTGFRIEVDEDGQLIVHTNLSQNDDDDSSELVSMDLEEDDDYDPDFVSLDEED